MDTSDNFGPSSFNRKPKKRVIKDFNKLDKALQNKVRLQYPGGFKKHIISFYDQGGNRTHAIPYETDEVIFLLRLPVPKNIYNNAPSNQRPKTDEVSSLMDSSELSDQEYSDEEYNDDY